MLLSKYYQNIFNTQSFVVWQTVIMLFYTASTKVRNLTILSSITDKINRISNQFWHGWRDEYVVNLCETQ